MPPGMASQDLMAYWGKTSLLLIAINVIDQVRL